MKKQKIFLIINEGRIGDLLVTTPLCQEIKTHYPNSKLIFITAPYALDMLKNVPEVDECFSFDKKNEHKGFFGILKFVFGFKYFKKVDFCFVVHRYFRGNLLGFLLGAKRRISDYHDSKYMKYFLTDYMYKTEKQPAYMVKRYANYINFDKTKKYELTGKMSYKVDEESQKYVANLFSDYKGKKLVVLSFNHHWNAEKLSSLAKEICKLGHIPVILGTTDNFEFVSQLEKLTKDELCINLINKTTLMQVFAIIEYCDLTVSVDTGTMHMAVALEKPNVALTATNLVECWAHKDKSSILVSKNLEKYYSDISVNDVVEKIVEITN